MLGDEALGSHETMIRLNQSWTYNILGLSLISYEQAFQTTPDQQEIKVRSYQA